MVVGVKIYLFLHSSFNRWANTHIAEGKERGAISAL